MLNVAKLVPEQASYYEQSVARGMDDYYAGRGEAPGQWIGQGASELGLHGEIEDGQLQAVLSMRNPQTGGEIRERARTRTVTVQGLDPLTGEARDETKRLEPLGGYDCVFSTPKSLSVLEAIADPLTPGGRYAREAVRAAHEAGLAAAFGYLQERACVVRRGHAGAERVRATGFVGARFDHRTSRAQDPHRHSHVILANAARTEDGTWRALDGQAILAVHRLAAGYLYEAAVRAEMASHGFRFGPVHKGMAELDGMPATVVREFSTRRQQVVDKMQALGVGGYYGASGAARSTRAPKKSLTAVALDELRENWRARASEHGFGQPELAALVREAQARVGLTIDGPAPGTLADALSGPEGLTERRNTFARPNVVIAVAAAHQQGATRDQVETFVDAYLADDARVVTLPQERHTTHDLLAREREILAHAERRRDAACGVLSPTLVDQVIAERAARGRPLSGEQADAVRAIATSGRGLELVRALAGSGKTHTMGALADCYRAAGYEVVGCAPTARAARELGRVGIEARTLDALVLKLDRDGGFPTLSRPFERERPIVVLNDEAGMNGTRMWARLLEHAERAGAKVVAVGDERQLQSVAAGGAFRALTEREGAHTLRQVHRQRDPVHRQALSALREGRPAEYVRWQVGGDRLVVADHDAASSCAVSEWAAAQADLPWGQAALICRGNELRDELNLRARAEASARGWLGADRLEVGGREFRVGDRVVARRNDRALDADNGDRGTVTALDPARGAISVRIDDGRRLVLPRDYLEEGRVEHAYALTAHSAQGATLERAFVVARPEEHAREWSYTAASRERAASRAFLIDDEPEWEQERHGPGPAPLRGPLSRYLEALGRVEAEPLAAEQAQVRPFAPEWEDGPALRPVRDLGAGAEGERRQAREQGPGLEPGRGPSLGV